MKCLFALVALIMLPISAHAEKSLVNSTLSNLILGGSSAGCTTTETTSVSISFNSIEKDVQVASSLIEKKTAEVKELAKQVGVEKADIASVNYNMNPYNNGYPSEEVTWQVSGSMSVNVTPPSKAKDFLLLLTKNKYQPSLSVSAYRSGNCQ